MFLAFISAVFLYIRISRSKGRLPVLTYYHAQTSAALLRCAQPLSGIKGGSLKGLLSKFYVTLHIKSTMSDSQLYPCNLYLINNVDGNVAFIKCLILIAQVFLVEKPQLNMDI